MTSHICLYVQLSCSILIVFLAHLPIIGAIMSGSSRQQLRLGGRKPRNLDFLKALSDAGISNVNNTAPPSSATAIIPPSTLTTFAWVTPPAQIKTLNSFGPDGEEHTYGPCFLNYNYARHYPEDAEREPRAYDFHRQHGPSPRWHLDGHRSAAVHPGDAYIAAGPDRGAYYLGHKAKRWHPELRYLVGSKVRLEGCDKTFTVGKGKFGAYSGQYEVELEPSQVSDTFSRDLWIDFMLDVVGLFWRGSSSALSCADFA